MPDPPWPTTETKCSETYDGHCHCGTVRFNITLSPPLHPKDPEPDTRWNVIRCNCSVCTRNGYLLVHPPISKVQFIQGEDKLGRYQFGNKRAQHQFCSVCGSSVGIDLSGLGDMPGGPRQAINAGLIMETLIRVWLILDAGPYA